LDDGCLWGGCLTALKLDDVLIKDARLAERFQVKCPQSKDPLK